MKRSGAVFYTVYVLESFTPTSCLREQIYFQGVGREGIVTRDPRAHALEAGGSCFVL